MASKQVFEWCEKCEYVRLCYDEYGGPWLMDPACGDGPVIKEVENGK